MTLKQLRVLLSLFMCSDPWPLSEVSHEFMTQWLDAESRAAGYADWIDAYHKLPEEHLL